LISVRPPCKRAPPDDVMEAGSNPSSSRTVPRVRPLPASVLVRLALSADAALDRTTGCYPTGILTQRVISYPGRGRKSDTAAFIVT
jgi:hypothetical protein